MANSAHAATVQFNDLASFNAATITQNIDFEGTAGSGGILRYRTLTTNGVTFTAPTEPGGILALDPAINTSNPTFYNWGSGTTISTGGNPALVATLPSGITAVGGDISSFQNYASPFRIQLSTGETFSVNSLNYPNRRFIGFTSTTDIASISFTATGGATQLDNFRFGTANPASTSVPEPFTIIGTLVGGTAALRMRKKLKSAVSSK